MNILLVGCDVFGLDTLLNSPDTYTLVDYFAELGQMPQTHRDAILSHVTTAPDVNLLLKPGNFDMAIVGVPNFAKNRVSIECNIMRAHIPLFINKLRLERPSDCSKMTNASKQCAALTMVGEFYRRAGGVSIAKDLIESGRLGKIEQIGYLCSIPSRNIAKWENAYSHLVLEDLAFHHFSVLDYLLESHGGISGATVLYAASRSPQKAAPLTGTVANVALALGATFIDYHVNWHSTIHNTGFFGVIDIDCENGSLSIERDNCEIAWADGSIEQRSKPAGLPPVLDMTDAIRHGQTCLGPSLIDFKPIIDKIYEIIAFSDA